MPVLVEIVFNKNNCTVGQFFASASLIMDSLCIFVITTQCVFSLLLTISAAFRIIFLLSPVIFLYSSMNKCFIRTANYFFSGILFLPQVLRSVF